MLKQSLAGEIQAMKAFFDRSTSVLEEADASFTPQPGMFTTVGQMAHAAQTVEWFIDGAFAPTGFDLDFEKHQREMENVASIIEARAWMDRACAKALHVIEAHTEEEWRAPLPDGPVMGGMPRTAIFGAMTDHTAHHRGALTVYARLLGKIPPMPYA